MINHMLFGQATPLLYADYLLKQSYPSTLHVNAHLSIYLSIYLSTCIYLSIHLVPVKMAAFTWRPVKLLEFDHHGNVMVLCTEDKKVVLYDVAGWMHIGKG